MFTMVKASEVFPMRSPVKECERLGPVHPLIPGECLLFLGETRTGVVSLSNYRLYVSCPNSSPGFINIPLGLVEGAEQRDMFFLHIYCKDARSYRIQFSSSSSAEEWTRRLMDEISPPVKLEDIFAFAHFAWASESGHEELGGREEWAREDTADIAWFRSELTRLRFDLQSAWRVSKANQDHKLCPTYPQDILIPSNISDSALEKVAQFRSARRIPAVVWRNTANGAVLARCSQPEVGWLGWRSAEDEELVRAIAEACGFDNGNQRRHDSGSETGSCNGVNGDSQQSMKDLSLEAGGCQTDVKKVLIIDARSYAAAVGNRARGGGVECAEYYPNAEILFMNLANIHGIRKSFQGLRALCQAPPDQTSWFQAIDSTKWLTHMSGLLRAAVRCVTALQTEGRPVIVHCSDGWDRTPQIVSLSQLLLDPYYRTLEGFQVLVEKEWLDFGHKMADRCGQGLGCSDMNERSPIFLQWLDCVHQLLLQFPCHFEFNLTFLVKLAEHTYSNLFGTFLANSASERRKMRVRERTRSIWGYLRSHPSKFRNFLFVRREEVLWPRCEVRDLLLWQSVYVWEGQGGAGGVSNSQGSREGSESGEGILAEEIDKLQQGSPSTSKESTPDVCPEYKGLPSVSSLGESGEEEEDCKALPPSNTDTAPSVPQGATSPRLERRKSLIESSTDTLVSEMEQERNKDPSYPCNGSITATVIAANSHQRLLEEAMGSSSCSNGFLEPLDSDGLVAHNDQIQRRMVEIFSHHMAEVSALRRDLTMARMALTQAGIQPGELTSGVEEEVGVEVRSGVESTNSEVSWEAVEEGETRPTLWVPDHAVSQCMGCHTQFWFGRRKHHCRSCGLLFCSDCSEMNVPLPAEQLYQPVRVCDRCYKEISGHPIPPRNPPILTEGVEQMMKEKLTSEQQIVEESGDEMVEEEELTTGAQDVRKSEQEEEDVRSDSCKDSIEKDNIKNGREVEVK